MGSSKELLKEKLLNNSISLKKFLINYCGVPPYIIVDKKISHSDVKKLIPNIKRVRFDDLKYDNQKIYNGDIVIVEDSFGNLAPYCVVEINNFFGKNDDYVKECDTLDVKEKIVEKAFLNTDLDKISKYELVELCRYYKKHKRLCEYRVVDRFIKLRKNNNGKKYKKEKVKLIMKGREFDEEY